MTSDPRLTDTDLLQWLVDHPEDAADLPDTLPAAREYLYKIIRNAKKGEN